METKFFITNEQYGRGFQVEEYAGKIKLVSARKAQTEEIYKDWAFPQDNNRKPRDKAIPVQIDLGTPDEAIARLKCVLDLLEGNSELPPVAESEPTNIEDSDIPF